MKRALPLLALCALLCAVPVQAEEDERDEKRPRGFGLHGWGFRVGVGDDPDQVVAGVQFDHGEFEGLHLEPNIEIAAGDDRASIAGTYAVHYRFRHVERFRPYVGGGLGLAIERVDPPNGDDDTDLDIGMRAIGGFNWNLKSGREVFLEATLGVGFVHDAQLMFGWTF